MPSILSSLPAPNSPCPQDQHRLTLGQHLPSISRSEDVTDLAGWQADIIFDPAVVRAKKVNEGELSEARR